MGSKVYKNRAKNELTSFDGAGTFKTVLFCVKNQK